MRAIERPNLVPQAVYETCINSISDSALRNRLNLITHDLMIAATDYEQKADAIQLFTLAPNTCQNNDPVLGFVTKKELKDIYTNHFVPEKKPARKYYDLLLSKAHLSRCPYCGIGHVSTLDHFLPKSPFPQFSVLPLNLVPACKDCNEGKNATVTSAIDKQDLHPYFDHQHFINDQWLYADIEQSSPITIRFFVNPPNHWNDISKNRVQAHFIHFNLAARYKIEASSELANISGLLTKYLQSYGQASICQHLTMQAENHLSQHVNSWQTALYQALATSTWYCNGGFQ